MPHLLSVSTAFAVALVSLPAQAWLGSVNLAGQPIGSMAVDPVARRVHVAGGYGQAQLTVVDVTRAARPSVLTTLPYAGAAVLPARNRLYVSTGYGGALRVLDATTLAVVATPGVGYCGGVLDTDSDTGLVYLMSQCGGGNDPVHVLDANSNTIVAGPLGSGGVANLVRVNPATGRCYAARSGGTRVFGPAPAFAFVVDLPGTVVATSRARNRVFLLNGAVVEVRDGTSHTLLGSIPGSGLGVGAVVDDARGRLYITEPAAQAVRVFDADSLAAMGSFALPTGHTPWLLGLDPLQGVLFAGATQGGTAFLHSFSVRSDVSGLPADPLLPQPGQLATDGTTLFVGNQSPLRLAGLPVSGGAATALYPLPAPYCCVNGLGVAGADLFWIDPNSGPVTDTQIFRAPKSGSGPVQPIYTGSQRGQPIVDGSDLATDGAWLYTADYYHGRVHRVSLDGATIQQLGPERYSGGFATEQHVAIAVHAGTVFVCDVGRAGTIAPGVRTIPAAGGAFATLWSGAPFVTPIDIEVANGTVFVADPGAGNTIWTLPVSGGTPRALVRGGAFVGLRNLLLHADRLWVSDGDGAGSALWRVSFGVDGYGAGCLGSGGFVPRLDFHGGPPSVGNTAFGLQLDAGLGGAVSALFLGLGQSVAGLPLGADCKLHLDPTLPFVNVPPPIALTGAGAGNGFGVFALPLPLNPTLVGGSLFLQALSLDVGGGTGAFTLTRGVAVRLLAQ